MGMTEPRFSILVVDDNAVNRLAFSRWLEKTHEYRVLTAADGMEALDQVEKDAVDLVLLDIMMPVMSGLDVLKRLRKTYAPDELPVIMATAKDQSEDMVEAFNLGANDYITKPIDFPVALARVQAQLRASEIPRQSPSKLAAYSSLQNVEPGTVLEGRYRLDSLIGSGQFGTVYRATHLNLRRDVAIKLLHTGIRDDEKALQHFQQEGISACRVDHPNAVAIFDFTATRFGIAFMVMELLRGQGLDEALREQGKMPPERAAEILLPICDVLAEAHSVGIIHRDIKPQNIFLHQSRHGEVVKVLDFGLAKLLRDTSDDLDASHDGIAGTLGYLAPERALAESYDGRADVYSLGCMFFEMLTGRMPFIDRQGNPLQVMMMHVRDRPPRLRDFVPDVDPIVEDLVLKALAKDPEHRPTASEYHELLMDAFDLAGSASSVTLGEQSGFVLRALLEEELRKSGYDMRGKPLKNE